MKIVLTGGGTAGHVMPHIALMKDFEKHFDKIIYIGSKNGIEKELISKHKNVKFYSITTTKLVRSKIFTNFLIPYKLIKGINEAKKILKKENPDIIFSKGGFVSLPVVIAAKKLKIPIVAHESDLNVGLANRLSKPMVNVICTTFQKTADSIGKKAVFTGSPMRVNMKIDKEKAKKTLGIQTEKPILLVTGGSLGAKFINEKIQQDIKQITDKFFVIHIVGKSNINKEYENIKGYLQFEFINDIGLALSCADLVVSRAGSNTIFELATFCLPMLLIPLPKGNSRGDQVDNAKYFNQKGYCNFISQEQLEQRPIYPFIMETYKDSPELIRVLKASNIEPGNKKVMKEILKALKKEEL